MWQFRYQQFWCKFPMIHICMRLNHQTMHVIIFIRRIKQVWQVLFFLINFSLFNFCISNKQCSTMCTNVQQTERFRFWAKSISSVEHLSCSIKKFSGCDNTYAIHQNHKICWPSLTIFWGKNFCMLTLTQLQQLMLRRKNNASPYR